MPRFFCREENFTSSDHTRLCLTGGDARHIGSSLRMKVGDTLTVCDFFNKEYDCVIDAITPEEVMLRVLDCHPSENEPSIFVRVFQALPKNDKMELVIQKGVELGASEFIPVLTSRCISRPDEAGMEKKRRRWNSIAAEAAGQAGRGCVPTVAPLLSFPDAIAEMQKADLAFLCYENEERRDLATYLEQNREKLMVQDRPVIAFFVGPEGGIAESEAQYAADAGVLPVSLGRRILRTETAPLCVVAGLMFLTGNMK